MSLLNPQQSMGETMPLTPGTAPKSRRSPFGTGTFGGTSTGMPQPIGVPGGGATGGPTPSTSFTASNNLIGSQINPTNSAPTNQAQGWTTTAGQQYNNFQLSPFQGVQPLDFGTERGMLNGANGQMQGLQFNFNPANSQYGNAQQQLSGAAGQAGQMLNNLASGGGNYGSGTASASTSRFNSELDGALDGLKGPNRGEIGEETLALLEQRSQPGFEQSLRAATQKAAAMGRRGAGMTTNELGDITSLRERDLSLARRDVANDAAGQTLSDRLNISNQQRGVANDRFGGEQFNAGLADAGAARNQQGAMFGANLQRGIAGDLYGMGRDQSNLSMGIGDRYGDQNRDEVGLGERKAGFTRGIANDLGNMTRDTYQAGVNERDTSRRDEYDQDNLLGNKFDRNAGYLGQREGQDRSNRNEVRGERGYQYGLSRDSIDDSYRQQGWEESLRDGRYNRGMGYSNVGFGGQSPAGAYGQASNYYGGQAQQGYGAASDFMTNYFANQGRGRRTGAGGGINPGGFNNGGNPEGV